MTEFISEIYRRKPGITKLEPLPEGGQKVAFKGVLNKEVIVFKIIKKINERVFREIEAVKKVKSKYVPTIIEWGEIELNSKKYIFLIENFIEGLTLRNKILNEKRLSSEITIKIIGQLLDTLCEVEEVHLVHRDVKPENIIIDLMMQSWLLDFGIARHLDLNSLTETLAGFGPHTPGYSAPEQFRNRKKEVDIRADIFSVGVIGYECISGVNPFILNARNPLEVLRRIETQSLPRLPYNNGKERVLSDLIACFSDRFLSRRPRTARQAREWFNQLI